MEQYANLPGFFVDTNDRGLQIMPTVDTSERVTFIGTALEGPYLSPQNVSSPEEAEAIFGTYQKDGVANGKNLVLAVRQAYGAGCRNFTLVRVQDGEYAKLVLVDTVATPVDQIVIWGRGTGVAYNAVKVTVTTGAAGNVTIKNNAGISYIFNFTDYPTVNELIIGINNVKDKCDAIAELASTGVGTSASTALATKAETALTGGKDYALGASYDTDDVTNGNLKYQINKAYTLLMDVQTDILVPLNLFVDASTASVDISDADKLTNVLSEMNSRESRAIGVIAVKELTAVATTDVTTLVNRLTGAGCPANIYYGLNGEDAGKYLNIVVGEPVMYDVSLGLYSDAGAAIYAGLISALPPHSATTNKVLANVRGLRYSFTASQLDSLTAKRYVTFRNRTGRGIVVTDGITMAQPLSDYQRLSTLRISNAMITVVRGVTEPFIGEALDASKFEAINTAIEAGLKRLRESGAIQAYDFRVYFESLQDQIAGILTIDLAAVPAFEIRRIRLKVTLKPTL
jgi:hypothetical protein